MDLVKEIEKAEENLNELKKLVALQNAIKKEEENIENKKKELKELVAYLGHKPKEATTKEQKRKSHVHLRLEILKFVNKKGKEKYYSKLSRGCIVRHINENNDTGIDAALLVLSKKGYLKKTYTNESKKYAEYSITTKGKNAIKTSQTDRFYYPG